LGIAARHRQRLHEPNPTVEALPASKTSPSPPCRSPSWATDIKKTTAADYDPAFDLPDVQADIKKIAGHGVAAINWGWYQQGYDHEPTDAAGQASHDGYVAHHNAPQYFGYIANNPVVHAHAWPDDFFSDIKARKLPASGVFYVRGGYGNIFGGKPLDPNPNLATVFNGNDDHPGYSDSQISEALLAREINAIAAAPTGRQSVILIAYDESDGLYDHARPRVRSHDAAGLPLDQGRAFPPSSSRPTASPTPSRTSPPSTAPSSSSSTSSSTSSRSPICPTKSAPAPSASKVRPEGPRPGRRQGRRRRRSALRLRQPAPARPRQRRCRPAMPRSPTPTSPAFPHMGGHGCKALANRSHRQRQPNPIPADFNPRPDTTPGIPTSGTWTP
jgi:phospholipase C